MTQFESLQEAIGIFSDRLEAIMAMENVPMPTNLKNKARSDAINGIIAEMREVYEQYTGENPWS